MRTAILAALKRTEAGEIRAFLPLGGRTVLAWQFDVVRSLGCERVICLCEAPGPDILQLQHEAEAAGVQFHAVRGPLQVVGLVTADQDLVMLLDGLVIAPDLAAKLSEGGRMIASLPAASSLASDYPSDFERIDATRAWAGLAIIRGSLAAKLADLPADSDTMSLLLRLGLQSGGKDVPLANEHLTSGELLLAADGEGLVKRQETLIARSAERISWLGPARALAATIVRQIAPRGLDQGPMIATSIGIGALLGMVAAFWFDQSVTGLSIGAIGTFALAFGRAGARLKSGLYGRVTNARNSRIFSGLQDALVMLGLALPALAAQSLALAALPILAIGLARLAAILESGPIQAFWADRTAHLMLFAICAIIGQLTLGIAVFALLALAQCTMRSRAS